MFSTQIKSNFQKMHPRKHHEILKAEHYTCILVLKETTGCWFLNNQLPQEPLASMACCVCTQHRLG